MKARSQIGLKEAARIVGKSPRQIMRDRTAGKLPARGGGRQGRRLWFDRADVEALRRRRSGVADVDLLARIAFAFKLKRAAVTEKDRQTCAPWLNPGFLSLWQWRKAGQEGLIEGFCRNGLPPLADVAPAVRDWARRIAQDLTPAEVDYLAAMFIVTEHSFAVHAKPEAKAKAESESNALASALRRVKHAKPVAFISWRKFRRLSEAKMRAAWRRIEGGVRADLEALVRESRQRGENPPAVADLLAGERRIFFDPRKREGAWQVFTRVLAGRENEDRRDKKRHHPFDMLERTLLSAYWGGDVDRLRSLIENCEDSAGRVRRAPFAEVQIEGVAPSSLLTAARKEKRQREDQGKAKPSGAKVAAVLGVHRFQATRYWRSILRKIGREGIAQLAAMLFLDAGQVPRSWRILRQPASKGGRQVRPLDMPLSDADFIRNMTQQVVYNRSADSGE